MQSGIRYLVAFFLRGLIGDLRIGVYDSFGACRCVAWKIFLFRLSHV